MQRLKPAHEIYKRLLWDVDCIPGGEFVIGYEDRFLGTMEKSREEFEADEIPFHRVRYFKAVQTNQILWDREKRVDLITRTYSERTIITSTTSTSLKETDESSDEEEIQFSVSSSIATGSSKAPMSTKQKKQLIKRKRQKFYEKAKQEARLAIAEEDRLETEHEQMYMEKLKEVEERIKRFEELINKD